MFSLNFSQHLFDILTTEIERGKGVIDESIDLEHGTIEGVELVLLAVVQVLFQQGWLIMIQDDNVFVIIPLAGRRQRQFRWIGLYQAILDAKALEKLFQEVIEITYVRIDNVILLRPHVSERRLAATYWTVQIHFVQDLRESRILMDCHNMFYQSIGRLLLVVS